MFQWSLRKRALSIALVGMVLLSAATGRAWAGVSFSSPANGSTVSGTVTVSLNPGSGTSWSNWYLDGVYQASTPPTNFSWDTNGASNGTHNLTATAYDLSGSTLGSGAVTVTVANGSASSGGAVSITSPANGSTISGTQTIAVSNGGSTSWANIYIDGVYAYSTPPSSFSWNTSAVSNGAHQVSATAFDSSDRNLGTSTANVTVANGTASPSSSSSAVTITSPSSGSTVSGSVNIAYSEGSGTSWVNVYIDGSYLASSPPTSVSWSSGSASNGSHTISANAFNSSGSSIGTASVSVNVSNGSTGGSTPSSSHFSTLSPGSALPTGDQCAAAVRRNGFEPRPDNYTANHTVPTDLSAMAGAFTRVDGNFTGTTDEILQWGACKWGFDEDLVRAIAATESWWRQAATGDFTYNTSLCPSGATYASGGCYETYSIVQIKANDSLGSFPNSEQSTAFAVDYKFAYQRACFEGNVSYLSERSSDYPSSNSTDMLWGCVDQWFTGTWWNGSDDGYISEVKGHMANKPWLNPGF